MNTTPPAPKTQMDYAAVPRAYFNTRRYVNQIIAVCLTWFLGLFWFRYRIQGRDKLPPPGTQKFVLVANHNSNWDPPMLAMAVCWRPLAFMAKQELFLCGGWSEWLYRNLGAFAVNRQKLEKKTIKTALMVMRDTDWVLTLFPEGTRHKDPDTLGEVKHGAVSLAKMGGLPILPVGLSKIGRHYSFAFGELMPVPDDIDAYNETLKATLLDLKLQAKQAINQHP
jgi:1-acyl-sn-glycerol-3-phosphate acyltransferase